MSQTEIFQLGVILLLGIMMILLFNISNHVVGIWNLLRVQDNERRGQ
jgi:hypothetical protein